MQSNPGIHRLRLGDVTVTALNDGQFEASTGLVTGVPAADCEAMLAASFRVSPPRITVSCFLLEWPDRTVVVDFGAGPGALGGALGHAASRLAALGVAPEAVDTVLLTHGHSDHTGGLATPDGAAFFPRAELVAHAAEPAYWAREPQPGGGEPTRAALAAYAGRTRLVEDGAAVLPGVTLHHLPGHTPGHSGYLVESGGASLLIWADIVHLPGIQFARPEAGLVFDTDGDQARATRARVLEATARDGQLVSGMHLDFPTFGHVIRRGGGYAFEPLVWAPGAGGLLV